MARSRKSSKGQSPIETSPSLQSHPTRKVFDEASGRLEAPISPLTPWTGATGPSPIRAQETRARSTTARSRPICEFSIVALVLDSNEQVIVHCGTYAVELILTATILALIPYVIVRGLVTRLARRQSAVSRFVGRPGNQATLGEDPRQERQEG
jgi:hypothetical protein